MDSETPLAPLKSSPVERPILHMPVPGPAAALPLSEPVSPFRGLTTKTAPASSPAPSAVSVTVSRTSHTRRDAALFCAACAARFAWR